MFTPHWNRLVLPLRAVMTSVRPLLVAACALASVAHGSFVGGSARSFLKVRPSLPAARFALMQAEAVVPPDDQSAAAGPLAKLKQSMPCATRKEPALPRSFSLWDESSRLTCVPPAPKRLWP